MFNAFFSRIACSIGKPTVSLGENITMEHFQGAIQKLKSVGGLACTICTLVALTFLVINIIKMATSAGNDNARASALRGILWSCVAFGLFGSGAMLLTNFWNLLH